ncbi:MAG: hypothetical protein ACFFD8_02295 [Candidatus Thorarchaeota archaeon]
MRRYILWMLQGIAVAAFVAFAAVILFYLDPIVWRFDGIAGPFTALIEFAIEIRNSITLLASFFIDFAAYFGAFIEGYLTAQLWTDLFPQYQNAIIAYFQAFGFTLTRPALEVPFTLLVSLYFLGFQILLVIGLIAGVLSFLRISGRLASLCFITMMALAILGAGGIMLNLPGGEYGFFLAPISAYPSSPDPIGFLSSPIFIVALISFVYLEASYQVVYFYSLLEPPTVREEQLRKQLQQLQTDAQSQVTFQPQTIPVPKALQRMLGSDAFQLMRQVIERKLLRREWLVELKDAHEVRRLNTFVSRVFREDSEAEAALTAQASIPSLWRMTGLSIGSSIVRFAFVILIAYICIHPMALLVLLRAPPIIIFSVEFMFLPEKTIIFLVPLVLLFPLIATILGYIRQRRAYSPDQVTQIEPQ